eukprot:g4305.t1
MILGRRVAQLPRAGGGRRSLCAKDRSGSGGRTQTKEAVPLPQELREAAKILEEKPELLEGFAQRISNRTASTLFRIGDKNADGSLSKNEFLNLFSTGGRRHILRVQSSNKSLEKSPSWGQLGTLAAARAVPAVVFGFMDNVIMIVGGDLIEQNIGLVFGLSTMAAAGIGNALSDAAGVASGSAIERRAEAAGLRVPQMSEAAASASSTNAVNYGAQIGGIVLGCAIGMAPLLFMEDRNSEAYKMKQIFDKIDVDKSGYITEDELLEAFEAFGISPQQHTLNMLMREADVVNPDGKISFAEFKILVKRWQQEMGEDVEQRRQKNKQQTSGDATAHGPNADIDIAAGIKAKVEGMEGHQHELRSSPAAVGAGAPYTPQLHQTHIPHHPQHLYAYLSARELPEVLLVEQTLFALHALATLREDAAEHERLTRSLEAVKKHKEARTAGGDGGPE